MENEKNKRMSILVEETETNSDPSRLTTKNRFERFKKPVIFTLMGVVFFACMYLVFKPSEKDKKLQDEGLNEAVPQATTASMQADKQKAYEQAFFEQKEQEKRNALISLSDYWNDDTLKKQKDQLTDESYQPEDTHTDVEKKNGSNSVLNSYRDAQNALGTFYQDNDRGTAALKKEISELKERLAEKESNPTGNMIDNQLALMEKSYQMAAKFFPSTSNGNAATSSTADKSNLIEAQAEKQGLSPFAPANQNIVSTLYQEPSDSEFVAQVVKSDRRIFFTPGASVQKRQPVNSVRAFVLETQTVTDESSVRIRLEDAARIKSITIPEGSVITAFARFNGGRLQLKVSSIEQEGDVIPVDIVVYDLDGQPGINIPLSAEVNAVTQIASNMGQAAGTSVMMTRSAGQQIAGDLSRGVLQGISGYISKKINTPKVTLKAGYHVLLVSKK